MPAGRARPRTWTRTHTTKRLENLRWWRRRRPARTRSPVITPSPAGLMRMSLSLSLQIRRLQQSISGCSGPGSKVEFTSVVRVMEDGTALAWSRAPENMLSGKPAGVLRRLLLARPFRGADRLRDPGACVVAPWSPVLRSSQPGITAVPGLVRSRRFFELVIGGDARALCGDGVSQAHEGVALCAQAGQGFGQARSCSCFGAVAVGDDDVTGNR